jgi:hypothetical protein
MIQQAAFQDFRNYIKKRLSYAQYRVGTTWYRAEITDISILSNGIVRVKIDKAATGVTINRVAVYSSIGEQWAYQDCNIVVNADQTGFLFWFDFTISEGSE